MELKPPHFLMLGMIGLGAYTGYAIKAGIEESSRFFWSFSLAQVYSELARLAEHGYLTRRESPHGGRERSTYKLTEQGEEVLRDWLLSQPQTPLQYRDEGTMQLFLADRLTREEQLELIGRLRERLQERARHMREGILTHAEAIAENGPQFPMHVARVAADTWDFVDEWYRNLETELLETTREDSTGSIG